MSIKNFVIVLILEDILLKILTIILKFVINSKYNYYNLKQYIIIIIKFINNKT